MFWAGRYWGRKVTFPLALVAAVASITLPAAAAPKIASLGVRNGGSYALPGLPNSAIAQGSLFIVFGQNLGPAKIVQVSSYPLPTTAGLAGTSIQVTINGRSVSAIMLYTLATQIAAVLPSTTPVGTGTLTVTYQGETSDPAPITVVASSFGIFSVNQSGNGPGVLQNVNSQTDRPLNSVTQSAQPGQVVILWGTGLGPVTGDETTGPLPGDIPNLNVHVWVGGKDAAIQYRGRSGCCTGDDQIVFVVPPGVEGCFVPVYVQIGSVTSNFVSMSIGNGGSPCSDPGLSADLLQVANKNGGLRLGQLYVSRAGGEFAGGAAPFEVGSLDAPFFKFPLALLGSGAVKAGFCTVNQQTSIPLSPNIIGLDAGKISVSSPGGQYDLFLLVKGDYILNFDPALPTAKANVSGTLKAGTYTFTGSGGADVGPFAASIDFPGSFQWDHTANASVDRTQPLPITWTGGNAGGIVTISGVSFAANDPVVGPIGAVFSCAADATSGSFLRKRAVEVRVV